MRFVSARNARRIDGRPLVTVCSPATSPKDPEVTVTESVNSVPDPLVNIVRFTNTRVVVSGPGADALGITSATGGYGINVLSLGGPAMGIACADVSAGFRTELVKREGGWPSLERTLSMLVI